MYKPNIVPVTRPVYRCSKGMTFIYSGKKKFCFGQTYDNSPLVTKKSPVSDRQCSDMVDNKVAPDGTPLHPIGNGDLFAFATRKDKSFNYDGFSSHSRMVTD